MYLDVRHVTFVAIAMLATACAPQSDIPQPSALSEENVTSPSLVGGTLTVPPPWVRSAEDGSCTAELRTTPFDASSEVTLNAVREEGTLEMVASTVLGNGSLRGDACAFSISLPIPDTDAQEYRLAIESSTKSLQVTWDYPAEVVEAGAPLQMPLTDEILMY